jgi:hypothetical protein
LCVCEKKFGGKKSLWHAKLKPEVINITDADDCKPGKARYLYPIASLRLCGAGNTGENAIKDLAKQLSWLEKS